MLGVLRIGQRALLGIGKTRAFANCPELFPRLFRSLTNLVRVTQRRSDSGRPRRFARVGFSGGDERRHGGA